MNGQLIVPCAPHESSSEHTVPSRVPVMSVCIIPEACTTVSDSVTTRLRCRCPGGGGLPFVWFRCLRPVMMIVEVTVPVNPWTVKVRVPLKSTRRRGWVKAPGDTVAPGATAARSAPSGPAQRLVMLTSGASLSLFPRVVIVSGSSGVDASAHPPADASGAAWWTISPATPRVFVKSVSPK